MATGEVISKSAAAGYIAEAFPTWAEVAARCRAHRHGDNPTFVSRDLREAIGLARHVRADAEARWPLPTC